MNECSDLQHMMATHDGKALRTLGASLLHFKKKLVYSPTCKAQRQYLIVHQRQLTVLHKITRKCNLHKLLLAINC